MKMVYGLGCWILEKSIEDGPTRLPTTSPVHLPVVWLGLKLLKFFLQLVCYLVSMVFVCIDFHITLWISI